MSNTMKTREAVLSALKPAYNRRVMVTLARHLIRAAGSTAANTRAGRSGTYASRRISGITFALMPPLHTLAPELRAPTSCKRNPGPDRASVCFDRPSIKAPIAAASRNAAGSDPRFATIRLV